MNWTRKALFLLGFILVVALTFFIIAVSRPNLFPVPPNRSIPASYGTGKLRIIFRDGTNYDQAKSMLAKLSLVNTNSEFMVLYVLVKNPVNVQSSPIIDLNNFAAKLQKLSEDPRVEHYTYGGGGVYINFKPTTKEEDARQILSKHNFEIYPGTNFNKSYEAEVTVPTGQEPMYIQQLLAYKIVRSASEPRIIPI